MGCGCGKRSTKDSTSKQEPKPQGASAAFRLTLPNGESLVYGSRLEAEAARVRAGRVGTIARF